MAENYQVRIRNKSITEWGRWHACFAGTRADGLPRYRPSPVSQMQQNNNRMSTLITTHPIFTRTEKEQQQSVDSSISFSSRFFFQNKNPTDEKLVQSINTSHRDRSPPFWASSSENAKSNLPGPHASDSVLVAVQFQFGSIFSIWLINLTIDSRERKR